MDIRPIMFSGTLKVRVCHVFWKKTPVHLTSYRQDYRSALPVLLIRRPRALGGEFHVHLDPCVHPVHLLPLTRKMASKLEFALVYGWQSKLVRLRAPDVATFHQWTSLVRTALESGRRPLVPRVPHVPRQDLECSSLASTLNSSNNSSSNSSTIVAHQPLQAEEEVASETKEARTYKYRNNDDVVSNWKDRNESFGIQDTMVCHCDSRVCVKNDLNPISIADLCSAATGSYSCNRRERDGYVNRLNDFVWSSRRASALFAEPSTEISWMHPHDFRTFSLSHLAAVSISTGDR
uniref:PH domain-containing protein n=1 Tax=Peronospora matthiolae TaxID=2874970 RepID=A0AAV1U6Z3_9STRA